MGEGVRHAGLMVAGVGIPVLAALNANLGARIGSPVAAAVVLFAVGFATGLVVLLATGAQGALARVPGQPPILFLAGCLMAFYILSITFCCAKGRAGQCDPVRAFGPAGQFGCDRCDRADGPCRA